MIRLILLIIANYGVNDSLIFLTGNIWFQKLEENKILISSMAFALFSLDGDI